MSFSFFNSHAKARIFYKFVSMNLIIRTHVCMYAFCIPAVLIAHIMGVWYSIKKKAKQKSVYLLINASICVFFQIDECRHSIWAATHTCTCPFCFIINFCYSSFILSLTCFLIFVFAQKNCVQVNKQTTVATMGTGHLLHFAQINP